MLTERARPFLSHCSLLTSSCYVFAANAATASTRRRMGSQATTPSWLTSLLESNNPAPKLYAWTPSNLGLPAKTQLPPSSSSTVVPRSKEDDNKRRIYILGIGNLGRMYAMYMRTRADPPPITLIVHRKELLSQWHESSGIEITYKGQVQNCKDFDIEWWTEEKPPPALIGRGGDTHAAIREAADGGTIRNLLVTTKAQAALPEVDRMRRYLDPQSTVAFAQNGMSKLWPPHGAAYMAARFPGGGGFNAILCVTNHGLYAEGGRPFSSVFASPADAYLGPVLLQDQHGVAAGAAGAPATAAPSVAYLTDQVTRTPILEARAFSSFDVWVLQLEKLVINTCVNPLTAILRCRTGGLFEEPEGIPAQVMDRLLASTSQILQALVDDPSILAILETDTHGRGVDAIRAELRGRFTAPRLRDMLHRAGIRVKDNKSSMLQDVEAGKPTTEIRDFNGWLVDMAEYFGEEEHGVDVSVHRKVIDLVERRVVMDKQQLAEYFLKE